MSSEKKRKSLINEKKKFEINIKKKNVEKIEAYYTLIKHLINVQTLMKLDSHSIY